MNVKRTWHAAAVLAAASVASLAGCGSVGIGIGLPIGRMGGITIGGTVPLPPRAPDTAASAPGAPASAPSAPAAPASAPAGR